MPSGICAGNCGALSSAKLKTKTIRSESVRKKRGEGKSWSENTAAAHHNMSHIAAVFLPKSFGFWPDHQCTVREKQSVSARTDSNR
jgi:hypothetical protein